MVDVGAKAVTERRAVARAVVRMAPETAALVAAGDAPKGDVLGVARIAGIQAAKRTDELIPLCHSLPLSFVDVAAEIDSGAGTVTLTAEARTTAQTGVEMEAMTAASVAALTVYDMVKGVERGVRVEAVELLEKSGGRSGAWRRA
jgi:cyclic pyranopterin monophosphate synthase